MGLILFKKDWSRAFWNLIPENYRKCRSFSDFWEAYSTVKDTDRHQMAGKEIGETCHVERWNNTLRQRICRFARKTLSLSQNCQLPLNFNGSTLLKFSI